MKKTVIALSIAAGMTSVSGVFANSIEDRLVAMEKRLQQLEQTVAAQQDTIRQKDQQIAQMSESSSSTDGSWFKAVEIGGVVEIEAQQVSPDGAADTSDIYVATAELGVAAQVNDWVSAEIVLLYEDDGSHSGEIDVDVATINIADPDSNWFMTTGQYTLPFGNYSTNLVSDPITLDAGETSDVAFEFGLSNSGLSGSIYAFRGDQESEIKNYGLNLGYEAGNENFVFNGGLGWLNDISETNSVVDDATMMTNKAAGWTAFAQFDTGSFTIIGEYLAATESLDAYSTTDEPSFFNIEAALGFNAIGKPAVVAIGYQGSDEASSYAGGMDEKRTLAALSMEIMDNTNIGIEYMKSEDYTGADTDTVTGQLAVEF
ncbi:MAG: carbohydrate porin [Gammaproteobacteria bacterium]|nr:carbohydrate porin [Gammaproteobacteria bacterium]